jgi:hypothetical protein
MKGLNRTRKLLACLVLSLFVLSVQGCTYFDTTNSEGTVVTVTESQPFYPRDFDDVLIPDGLTLDRNESMYIKSESFNGGILNYQGRLEVNSMTEFFENTMPEKGWTLSGSVKSANSLLIFTKHEKTCMISITESKLSMNTEVYIYISENLANQQ